MVATGREFMHGTLKGIKHMGFVSDPHRKSVPVFIPTDFAFRHGITPFFKAFAPLVPNAYASFDEQVAHGALPGFNGFNCL